MVTVTKRANEDIGADHSQVAIRGEVRSEFEDTWDIMAERQTALALFDLQCGEIKLRLRYQNAHKSVVMVN